MNAESRLERARCSLEGLSVGDAFGERLFVASELVQSIIGKRIVTAGPWPFTDDTQMALSVVEILRKHGEIVPDALALSFAHHYDDRRGYGPAMHSLLNYIRLGVPWSALAPRLFHGQGSCGNGAAMRVAPVGAYFADDLPLVVEHAARSAQVTHSHPEGVAGAVAVAVAAALAWQFAQRGIRPTRPEFLEAILPHVPEGIVREKIRHGRNLAEGCSVQLAVAALGNGSQIIAQDTVPFVLWCAGEWLDNFEEALWHTASGLGDRDTTCAMVGGIVAMYVGRAGIPAAWIAAREPLPDWPVA